MWRVAKKTDAEREDEEIARLVKRSPKKKPPRYDRRRERIKPLPDPDFDDSAEKKDMSLNYKGARRDFSYSQAKRERNSHVKGDNMKKFSQEEANELLTNMDRLAMALERKYASMGLSRSEAHRLIHALDKTADRLEISAFGRESFELRQAEVLQADPDESYMDTFNNPQSVHEMDSDEGYMDEYDESDPTSEVREIAAAINRRRRARRRRHY